MLQPITDACLRVGSGLKDLYSSRYVGLRIARGVFSLSIPIVFLSTIIILVEMVNNRYNIEHDSFWGQQIQWMSEIIPLLLKTILISVFIVYFLRLLYWLRTYGRAFWNEETAPHHQGDRADSNARVNRPLTQSKFKFIEWSVLTIIIWMLFLFLVLASLAIQSVLGWAIPEFASENRRAILQFAKQLPVVGQILMFEYYPGDGAFGTISYFIAAVPGAIAIRNLVFIFEYIDQYDYTEEERLISVILLSCIVIISVLLIFAILFNILIIGNILFN